jgi:hypothetical protein
MAYLRCGQVGLSFVLFSCLSWCKVLYRSGEVEVIASETAETMDFCVRASESVFASIKVDRNQNGRIDRGVDTMYSLTPDNLICTVFLLGPGVDTFCGRFVSEAKLTDMRHENGHWEYTYSVPKRELSFNPKSVWVDIEVWDAPHRSLWDYPRADLTKTIHIAYEIENGKHR